MTCKRLFNFSSIILLALLATPSVTLAEEMASKKFEMALNACERGLQMAMPKSKGSLIVLQKLLKKYQRHRDAALQLSDRLKNSEEYYEGPLFGKKTFAESYQLCERELADKIAKAQTTVDQKMKQLEATQQQPSTEMQALIEQQGIAKQEAIAAIDKYCANYLLEPNARAASTVYNNYRMAKQKALQKEPDIITQFHVATVRDTSTGKPTNANKTIQAWFEYCDTAFAQQGVDKNTDNSSTTTAATSQTDADQTVATNTTGGNSEATATAAPVVDLTTEATTAETPVTTETSPAATNAEAAAPSATTATATETPPQVNNEPSVEDTDNQGPNLTVETQKESVEPPTGATDTSSVAALSPATALVQPEETPTKTTTKVEPPVVTESPKPESSATAMANATPSDSQAADNSSVEDDEVAEYKKLLAKSQGDRLKVLKDEGRLPDFVDNEDYNYQKANIWQYEKANGNKCSMYTFKGNQLAKPQKHLKGACPPLGNQD